MIAIFNRANALKSLLVAGFIAISLWTMTAPAYAKDVDMYDNERGQKQTTERYDKIQSKTGGMNNFDAVDPRRNANEAKAQTLIDTAKRRKAQANDPLEPAREAISDLKSNVTGAADEATDKVANEADKLTTKAANAADRVGDTAASAANSVTNKADRLTDKAANAVDRVGSKADRLTDKAANAADRVGSKADRLTDKAARAADKAGDKLDRTAQNLTNRPANAAGRGGSIKPGRGDYQLGD